jgi:hypothetical protein
MPDISAYPTTEYLFYLWTESSKIIPGTMTAHCVETKSTYKFSKADYVLNDINLRVPEGAIYGF